MPTGSASPIVRTAFVPQHSNLQMQVQGARETERTTNRVTRNHRAERKEGTDMGFEGCRGGCGKGLWGVECTLAVVGTGGPVN
eukprot:672235-Prorocentrum_minimum.AAC.3